MHNEQRYDDLIQTILAAGKKVADEVEVVCSEGCGVSAELRRRIIGEAEEARSFGIVIRTIQDGHIGVSSTSDPAAWESCLHAAVASGHLATQQEWHGLPGPEDVSEKLLKTKLLKNKVFINKLLFSNLFFYFFIIL